MASDYGLVGGAGAAGIKDALQKILAQRLALAQLKEQKRGNLADEDFRNRDLSLRMQLRGDTLAEKKNQDVERAISLRGIGDPVTEGEFSRETTAGVPSSDYEVKPGAKVVSMAGFSTLPGARSGNQIGQPPPDAMSGKMSTSADDTSSLNAPRSISFRGTGAQRAAATKEDRMSQKSEADIQAKIDQLGIAAQNARTAGEAAQARIELAAAQAELARARAAHLGDAKPLSPVMADQMAGLNMAEVEGVKSLRLLDQLKAQTGGVDSNDPIDPRWQKFMVTTLKMNPSQWQKADLQQRVAAVNAILTRGLMGGRPAQYIAQMIQQHLPHGDMTPAQLRHVLENVLEQASERRMEVEGLTGRESGSLSPKSGETYEQYYSSSKTKGATNSGGGAVKRTPIN